MKKRLDSCNRTRGIFDFAFDGLELIEELVSDLGLVGRVWARRGRRGRSRVRSGRGRGETKRERKGLVEGGMA